MKKTNKEWLRASKPVPRWGGLAKKNNKNKIKNILPYQCNKKPPTKGEKNMRPEPAESLSVGGHRGCWRFPHSCGRTCTFSMPWTTN